MVAKFDNNNNNGKQPSQEQVGCLLANLEYVCMYVGWLLLRYKG